MHSNHQVKRCVSGVLAPLMIIEAIIKLHTWGLKLTLLLCFGFYKHISELTALNLVINETPFISALPLRN